MVELKKKKQRPGLPCAEKEERVVEIEPNDPSLTNYTLIHEIYTTGQIVVIFVLSFQKNGIIPNIFSVDCTI